MIVKQKTIKNLVLTIYGHTRQIKNFKGFFLVRRKKFDKAEMRTMSRTGAF